jgi:hypothetical protein
MGKGQPYKRFDDIWAGVIAKKAMDHLGWHLSVGEPFVEHNRASNPFKNLINEAPGIETNEKFWQIIDNLKIDGSNQTPESVMWAIGFAIKEMGYGEYIHKLGNALMVWQRLFSDKTLATKIREEI